MLISSVSLMLCSVPAQDPRSQPRSTTGPKFNLDRQTIKIVSEIQAPNIERTIRKLVSFGTRNTLSEQDNPQRGIGAARDWLYEEFQKAAQDSGGRMTVEKQRFVQPKGERIPIPTVVTNIVATLKGTQLESQNRLYVVSGHYDSMCGRVTDAQCQAPGANDDASGTAAVLEIARVMARYPFEATIIFMAVAGEEQGLLGSQYFAEQARKRNWDIEAMLTNDIIGNTLGGNGVRDIRTLRVFSEGVPSNETESEASTRRSVGGENDSPSRQLARFIQEVSPRYVTAIDVALIYRRDRYGRGGDHIPFLERGYAAVRLTEANEDFRHQHQNVRVENGIQYGDLPEFVDFTYVARIARVNAAILATLASAPAKPRNVGLLVHVSDDTELQWDENREPDLAGYEVVWRETTAPTWARSRWVGKVKRFTMRRLSKDNYFFGVRAVDSAGNRSQVSYPRPISGARR